MNDRERVEMLLFLLQNIDVFAWNPYEVPGVDPEFIVHKLNVDPLFPPKKQKPRRASKEHVDAVNLEVQRLKEAGAIKEIFFPRWLANTVVVKKKSGKWRVCVDFTDADGNDIMEQTIKDNYNRIKDEVKQIVRDELERIKSDPTLQHLLQQKG